MTSYPQSPQRRAGSCGLLSITPQTLGTGNVPSHLGFRHIIHNPHPLLLLLSSITKRQPLLEEGRVL